MASGWGTDLGHEKEAVDVARGCIGDGEHYVVIGRPESGYSLKVRSALRFKRLPHAWIDRCLKTEALYQAHAKVQLIPLVFLPDGTSMQDSTPILDRLESAHPEPSLHPKDPVLRFLSAILEEFGDEWGNKLMFHYRWGKPADQVARGTTLARGMFEGHWAAPFAPVVRRFIVRRMVPRMAFAGANANNAPILEAAFESAVELLEAHLAARPYLFGARPSFGDLGLWGQLYQAWMDPTCHAHLEARAGSVVSWLHRMKAPSIEGEFETLETLGATLRPIFEREVGPHHLAWALANERADAAGEAQTELEMEGRLYYQRTFKYPARTLEVLRGRAPEDDGELRRFLSETGCLGALEAPAG